jgi:hypothetical protein
LGNGYIAATWNRSKWTEARMAALKGSGDLELDSVSGVKPKGCVATGTAGSAAGTTGYSFSGTWNGKRWKLTAAA